MSSVILSIEVMGKGKYSRMTMTVSAFFYGWRRALILTTSGPICFVSCQITSYCLWDSAW